ncbi:ankyrin repeat domain-containing protein [Mucilaginibacter sp. RS28]|uniref:Ankyrin repeat domain-containing protein n=1 Tax=Mucilaginibacter straminoryzae TaxID=2932774 RepID=A0A9X1X453_9SPHI|nr:ankyrin repeat domain-containing protein [Mucilaginibacter straminoryzae]MCJ8210714.1 ankyrin repeat domain-containing protein [Mucilaginibacter straminoryzae]
MPDYQQVLNDIEVHAFEGIKSYFEEGGNPNEVHDGVPLFTTMVEMYLRSPRFKTCVRTFINYGLEFDDDALLAVLADDAEKLENLIQADSEIIHRTYSRYNNTFTPLSGATLLHFCAEYNHVDCAKVLVKHGANVDVRAGYDEHGFGGQTPVFHTVCQHNHNSSAMMKFLLTNGADLEYTVKGLVWGKGYEWETFIPAVNPISYASMGMLPQMHRNPFTIANVISELIKHAYGISYTLPNIPNAYLKK